MIALYVAGLIIAFELGFFICALFRVDGQAPRPIFKPIENLVEPPEDLTKNSWGQKEDADPPVPYIEPKDFGDDNEKE